MSSSRAGCWNVPLRRLRNFVALAGGERRLAVRALAWLVVCRLALRLVRFDRVRAWVEHVQPFTKAVQPGDVRRALQRAARTLPGSSCLAQSLVAERLLRAGGQPALLTVGVAGSTAPDVMALDAHAWVESGGMIVAGDGALERYAKLVTFGTRA